MSRHDRFQEMLARRAELSAEEEARLQEHLDQCETCHERAAAYTRQTALLRSLPMADVPPALRARVLSDIRQPRRAHPSLLRRSLLLGAPAALALILVVAALTYLSQRQQPSHTAVAPPTAPSTRQPPSIVRPPTAVPAPSHPIKRHAAPPHPAVQHRVTRPSAHTPRRPTALPTAALPVAGPPVISQQLPQPTLPAPAGPPANVAAAVPSRAAPHPGQARTSRQRAALSHPPRLSATSNRQPPTSSSVPPTPIPYTPPQPVATAVPPTAGSTPPVVRVGAVHATSTPAAGVSVSSAPLPQPLALPTPQLPPRSALRPVTPTPTPSPTP